MNKVMIIGNLTKSPISGKTNNGVAYCKFCVAVNRNYKDANGSRGVDFFNVIVWRGLVNSCMNYLSKGNKVSVVGSIGTHFYDIGDKKITVYDIIADEIDFLSVKSKDVSQHD